ncbi:MAG: 50S ribosomal protein P1 [Candidatus Nanoarchaeia archaeon]|jgi:large subunit ribosomal protein L12
MEYVYAAMVLHTAGKDINEANVKKVLEAAGVKPEDARVKALVSALDGVNIKEAIAQAAVPMMAAAPVAAAAGPSHAAPAKKEEEKKSAEEASAGLAGLFG